MVKLLLRRGANPALAVDPNGGDLAINVALQSGSVETARLLIEYGAAPFVGVGVDD